MPTHTGKPHVRLLTRLTFSKPGCERQQVAQGDIESYVAGILCPPWNIISDFAIQRANRAVGNAAWMAIAMGHLLAGCTAGTWEPRIPEHDSTLIANFDQKLSVAARTSAEAVPMLRQKSLLNLTLASARQQRDDAHITRSSPRPRRPRQGAVHVRVKWGPLKGDPPAWILMIISLLTLDADSLYCRILISRPWTTYFLAPSVRTRRTRYCGQGKMISLRVLPQRPSLTVSVDPRVSTSNGGPC